LFTASEADIPLRGQTVHITLATASPLGPVRVSLTPENQQPFTLRLRLPAWSRSARVTLNGAALAAEPGQGFLEIRRAWEPGDTVELTWQPALRLVPEGTNGFGAAAAGGGQPQQAQAALVYGPLVLMLDPSLNIYAMFEWGAAELSLPRTAAGEPFLTPLPGPILGRGELAVAGAGFMTLARPAGAEAGEALAFLVPMAELTDRWTFNLGRSV